MGSVVAIPLTVALSILATKILDLDYWGKWLTSFLYIEMFKRFNKKRFDLYDLMCEHDPCKVLFLPPPEETALESPLPERELGNSSDEVFFYGANSMSDSLTVRVSRRPDNESDAWVQLRLSDGRTFELNETSGFQQSSCDKKIFSCGDLQLHYVTPMRRWRIFFNGLMREKSGGVASSEKMVHVKFALLWRASADPFDFTADVSSNTLATGISKVKWNSLLPPLEKLKSAMNMYSQTGVILGNVTIEGDDEDYNLYLFGERMRFLVHNTLATGMEMLHVLGRTSKDGRCIHVVEASIPNIVQKFRFGFILQPNGSIKSISGATISLETSSMKVKDNALKTKFVVNDNLFEMRGTLFGEQVNLHSNNKSNGRMTMDYFNFHMNSFEGTGIFIKRKMKKAMNQVMYKQPVQYTSQVVPCVVHFSDKMCQDSEITGGKGSSLGRLTELSKQFQSFVVPNGIVVTTAAYKKFLSNEVIEEIKHLENSLCNNKCEDVKAACQRVVDKVIQSTFPESVLKEVLMRIKKAFPDEENTLKFAVRSSATGEDTEQMSAAGQMETYLGVTGMDEIMFAVKKCWASQFGHIAVQYKRQNGQVLNSPMAVVIQQMVSCDVAGVVFTCDPLTGNPTRVSITANYGLGESVVSGSEEPDTIELRRNENDKLAVENKMIGSKCRRIVVKDDEGTILEDIPEHERSACCLTDAMAIRLGDLAVQLQKSYRSHRDIEWGFWNNNLYIFQSRPVTSGTGETDFEIDHEHDAPLRVDNEVFTVCNVGEVMPGAMSPLGLEVLLKSFGVILKRPNAVDTEVDSRSKYTPSMMCCMYKRVMFNCVDMYKRIDDDSTTESTTIAMFGRLIEEEDLFELAKLRYSGSNVTWISNLKEHSNRFRTILFTVKKALKSCQNTYSSYRIPVEQYNTAQELFNAIMYSCTDLNEIFACHLMCSEASSVWNIIIFSILKNATGELNTDVYTDFSQLLTTSSEVESADVPASLEDLSSYISEDINPEEFRKMGKDEAVKWLQTSTNKSGVKYREFLHKHGHRCLREFDIHSKTWQTDPSSLIQLLQSTVGCARKKRTEISNDDFDTLISKLKTPLDFKQKLILKMLLPMSRKGVQDREISKSLLMRGMNAWRKSYTRLSQMMTSEGRIPDEDLLFYMNLEEIKELLSTRSPRILARANHRRRRHPILDKYIFPEISTGVPKPINVDTYPIISDDSLTMKGVPVSQGVTTGFVRVAITLEEASLLQAGEILVTYSTDIGWSPYFPLLAGVVTEIGGLISHGAVVSREYGLPCIAGLHGATRQFQTGDFALLDGNKGILQKLPKPDNF